jgi:hypothetical protein
MFRVSPNFRAIAAGSDTMVHTGITWHSGSGSGAGAGPGHGSRPAAAATALP